MRGKRFTIIYLCGMKSERKLNLQQYRNYTRSYKYLIRIVMYVAILVMVLLFLKYKLRPIKNNKVEDSIEIRVEVDSLCL
jgi:hypothetical protein